MDIRDDHARRTNARRNRSNERRERARRAGLPALLFAALALSGTPASAADPTTTPFCPQPLAAGAPACGAEGDPGSSPLPKSAPASAPRHVGNPIDVVSGNKYQREDDYRAFAGGLAFVRHYNSSLTDHDLALGPGWRHSYHVVLSRTAPDRLRVVQADGRAIEFAHVPGTRQPAVHRSVSGGDGVLLFDEVSSWHLPDGRHMRFRGSFLVSIDLADGRDALTLRYRNRRLDSVTDTFGRTLRLRYVGPNESLPAYGSGERWRPPGSLTALELPDGRSVRFEHDPDRTLVGVAYPDGERTAYAYDDAAWPSHLTGRESTQDGRRSAWAYDDHGRADTWREGDGGNGLSVERVGGLDAAEESAARVIYTDGREKRYRWTYGALADGHPDTDDLRLDCDGCAAPQSPRVSHPARSARPASAGVGRAVGQTAGQTTGGQQAGGRADGLSGSKSPSPPGRSTASGPVGPFTETSPKTSATGTSPVPFATNSNPSPFVANVRPAENGASPSGPNGSEESRPSNKTGEPGESSTSGGPTAWGDPPRPVETESWRVDLDLGERTIELRVMVDRLGEIRDLEIGGSQLSRIAADTLRGELADCPPPDGDSRLIDLADGAPPCAGDLLLLLDLLRELESGPSYKSGDPAPGGHPWNRPPPDPFCTLPPGRNCEQLEEDMDMALLAECAYAGQPCPPSFQEISPNLIGLPDELFDDDGFNAQLFYDPSRDRYTVAFRGTDGVGDDWFNNSSQGQGGWGRQYGRALELARRVRRALPFANLNFTGHSLGGGLASLAALGTRSEATVFNAAALHPNTADTYNLLGRYRREADGLIEHLHTASDPITVGQRLGGILGVPQAPGQNFEIPDPYPSWIDAHQESLRQSTGFFGSRETIVHHSMAAVIESLRTLIARHCSPVPKASAP